MAADDPEVSKGCQKRQIHKPTRREADDFLHKRHLEQQRLVGIVVDTHLIDAPNVDDHASISYCPCNFPDPTRRIILVAEHHIHTMRTRLFYLLRSYRGAPLAHSMIGPSPPARRADALRTASQATRHPMATAQGTAINEYNTTLRAPLSVAASQLSRAASAPNTS